MGKNNGGEIRVLRQLETKSLLRKKILLFVAILIVSLTVVEIWTMNRLSTYGERISKLEQAKKSLVLENQILENQIAKESSLKSIDAQSKALGFFRVGKVEYIKQTELALTRN